VGDIEVQLGRVREFGAAVRAEVDRSVRPGTEDLFRVYRLGVCFGEGWWRSEVVQSAQWSYHGCLTAAGQALSGVVRDAEVLVAAAEYVAGLYEGTDALATAKTEEIGRVFDWVTREAVRAQAAQEPDGASPKDVL
jgi:hypothetical protein